MVIMAIAESEFSVTLIFIREQIETYTKLSNLFGTIWESKSLFFQACNVN